MSTEENTIVEVDNTVEAAPAPEVNAPEEVPEMSLDDLMNADFGDDAAMTGTHKGLPDYNEILKHLPENGRKLIQNLRQSYTTKTQDIAELRRQVEAERAEIGRQKQLMSESEFAKNVAQLANQKPQHDAWSDEGLEERINTKAAQLMQQMLKPLQEDIASQSRTAELNNFKNEHPDLTSQEMRVPIARLLIDRPELKLADAYYIVKGQQTRLAIDTKRATQAATLQKTGTGSAVRAGNTPQFKDAWSAYEWHKANGTK